MQVEKWPISSVYLDGLGTAHNCYEEFINNNTILRDTFTQVLIFLCLL